MKAFIIVITIVLTSCSVQPESVGRLVATSYKLTEGKMSADQKAALKISYKALEVATGDSDLSSADALVNVAKQYAVKEGLSMEVIVLAELGIRSVCDRLKLGDLIGDDKVQVLRRFKSGIDEVMK